MKKIILSLILFSQISFNLKPVTIDYYNQIESKYDKEFLIKLSILAAAGFGGYVCYSISDHNEFGKIINGFIGAGLGVTVSYILLNSYLKNIKKYNNSFYNHIAIKKFNEALSEIKYLSSDDLFLKNISDFENINSYWDYIWGIFGRNYINGAGPFVRIVNNLQKVYSRLIRARDLLKMAQIEARSGFNQSFDNEFAELLIKTEKLIKQLDLAIDRISYDISVIRSYNEYKKQYQEYEFYLREQEKIAAERKRLENENLYIKAKMILDKINRERYYFSDFNSSELFNLYGYDYPLVKLKRNLKSYLNELYEAERFLNQIDSDYRVKLEIDYLNREINKISRQIKEYSSKIKNHETYKKQRQKYNTSQFNLNSNNTYSYNYSNYDKTNKEKAADAKPYAVAQKPEPKPNIATEKASAASNNVNNSSIKNNNFKRENPASAAAEKKVEPVVKQKIKKADVAAKYEKQQQSSTVSSLPSADNTKIKIGDNKVNQTIIDNQDYGYPVNNLDENDEARHKNNKNINSNGSSMSMAGA
ncbi:hypothetical protein KJ644_00260 [Candidatus Dependentiae bacterium]|nr:hypothetical protein [Candidatus Dependentiae bacterium]MBU4386892.1 hypothetical protein [Candidatus Dependentiae bacterium]MCG2756564.1 hypothetical protein [Candidatus Dependentiae bacterium]